MKVFVAGIMRGSETTKLFVDQKYRTEIKRLILHHFPDAEISDPLEFCGRKGSNRAGEERQKEVYFTEMYQAAKADVLIAWLPEASMGTAVEMWFANRSNAKVITISPMKHNWTVKFLSHEVYETIEEFAAALPEALQV